jgi:hypothetical protein
MARLCQATRGSPGTVIALVDGFPVLGHASLQGASIEVIEPGRRAGQSPTGKAAAHSTFIASMLVGTSPEGLGLCPGCRMRVVSAVDDDVLAPEADPREAARRVASGIVTAAVGGAQIVQLSLELGFEDPRAGSAVAEAVRFCVQRDAVVVLAVGPGQLRGANPLLGVPGVVAVSSAPDVGRTLHDDRWRAALTLGGLQAPGTRIPGARLPTGFECRAGSSFAASFVSAALALLVSAVPGVTVAAAAAALKARRTDHASALIANVLDGDASLARLQEQAGGNRVRHSCA